LINCRLRIRRPREYLGAASYGSRVALDVKTEPLPLFLLKKELDKPDVPVKIFNTKPQLRLRIPGGNEWFIFLNPASNDREVAYGLV